MPLCRWCCRSFGSPCNGFRFSWPRRRVGPSTHSPRRELAHGVGDHPADLKSGPQSSDGAFSGHRRVTIAALNIVGMLDPTIELLDSVALNLGDLRVSVLTVVKGVLSLAILLWVATTVSRLLEQRHYRNSEPDNIGAGAVYQAPQDRAGDDRRGRRLAYGGHRSTAFAVLPARSGVGVGFGLQKMCRTDQWGRLADGPFDQPGDVIAVGEVYGWVTSMGARYVSVVHARWHRAFDSQWRSC